MHWTIDPSHSRIEFSVKHMAIATVRGHFRNFTFDAETNARGELLSLAASIDATSIDTNAEQRDAHLRSPDFLDAANHPTLEFRSTRITRSGAHDYDVEGALTIRGLPRPVQLQVVQSDAVRDPWGNQRVAAEVTGKLSRKDWGLTWNQALEFGGVLVGDEVKFSIDVQAVAREAAAVA
jgi:polyisoprenoid-binding protein YceI